VEVQGLNPHPEGGSFFSQAELPELRMGVLPPLGGVEK